MDVVGFGALNLDRLYGVEKLAGRGEHEEITDVRESPGGSSANTISGLARLGFEAGFIGAVGDDPEGRILIDSFTEDNVDTEGICIIKGRTGIVIGFVDSEGERTLYPYPGVNNEIRFRHVDVEYVKKARILHLSSFVNREQFKTQKRLVREVYPEVEISFSPGILYARFGLRELKTLIGRSRVVFLNDSEIREITNKEYVEGSSILVDAGAQIIVVTLGGKGCFITDGEDSYKIKAVPTGVVDTTGAGDAFAAGFLYALIKKKSIKDAGEIGNKLASLCIQKFGARCDLPKLK